MSKVHPKPAPESARTLRRLPSVYLRSLELPLPMSATVYTYICEDYDYYVVPRSSGLRPSRRCTVSVHTVRLERYGMVRVVVHTGTGEPYLEDDMVYDQWRGTLSSTAVPSMAVAGFLNGKLVVIVPKAPFVVDGDAVQGPALSFAKYFEPRGERRPRGRLCGLLK